VIALHADTSSLTAITNDYGGHESFARQVFAHGRPGDVLIAPSTSRASRNVVSAAKAHLFCLAIDDALGMVARNRSYER
jgi:D-sedoheptulose 7-phosphate isomerase